MRKIGKIIFFITFPIAIISGVFSAVTFISGFHSVENIANSAQETGPDGAKFELKAGENQALFVGNPNVSCDVFAPDDSLVETSASRGTITYSSDKAILRSSQTFVATQSGTYTVRCTQPIDVALLSGLETKLFTYFSVAFISAIAAVLSIILAMIALALWIGGAIMERKQQNKPPAGPYPTHQVNYPR